MLNAIIVDDEPLVLSLLKSMLLENGVNIIAEYIKSEVALQEIPIKKPDIVFLDIEMPGMNGIELAIKLLEIDQNISIVFVTAYDKYAIDAFKLNAVHYILKPPAEEEIKEAISRIETTRRFRDTDMPGRVYIRLFGGVGIADETGKSIMKWPTTKTEELFALLILSGKKGIDKWNIIEKLWPENEHLKIENTLYTTIYRMKTALSEAGINAVVINKLGNYSLAIESAWCDIHVFEKLYKENKMPTKHGELLEEKVFMIYTGELFGSKDYVWAELHRQYFSHKFERMCEMIVASYKKSNHNERINYIMTKKKMIHK